MGSETPACYIQENLYSWPAAARVDIHICCIALFMISSKVILNTYFITATLNIDWTCTGPMFHVYNDVLKLTPPSAATKYNCALYPFKSRTQMSLPSRRMAMMPTTIPPLSPSNLVPADWLRFPCPTPFHLFPSDFRICKYMEFMFSFHLTYAMSWRYDIILQ